MRSVDLYTLAPARGDGPRTLVRRGEREPGIAVDGAVLEAQFALSDGSALVWLTDDSPHEEGLHVYLLGPDGAVRDAVAAAAAWAAGIVAIRSTGDGWAEFEFFRNGSIYRLDVEPTPGVRLRLPRGWRYKSLLRTHWLVVRQVSGG